MKYTIPKQLTLYLYNNFLGNFVGFVVGILSTRLVSHFFATRSIKNLWGLASKKTLVDKQTFNILEWSISIFIGFLVFEIISKALKKKLIELVPIWKISFKRWMEKDHFHNQSNNINSYTEKDVAMAKPRSKKLTREVQ